MTQSQTADEQVWFLRLFAKYVQKNEKISELVAKTSLLHDKLTAYSLFFASMQTQFCNRVLKFQYFSTHASGATNQSV